jgi:formylglycine-generating enzyme required for sulfatase activity
MLVPGVALVARQATATQAPAAPYHEKIAGTLVSFEMVPVPAGRVTVDGPAGAREVDVPAFFIGRTEVTWDLYDVYALRLDATDTSRGAADAVARPSEPYGAPDRGWGHAGYPAMSVTRAAAEAFCAWLSAKTGRTYRLPTDDEWTYAATLAAGRRVPLFVADLDRVAWHAGNAEGTTHAVGKKAPDALGLFDLFGNVGEWVTVDGGALIIRGGSYRDAATAVGPRARATQDPTWNQTDPQLPKSRWWLSDGPFAGFRLVSVPRPSGVHP